MSRKQAKRELQKIKQGLTVREFVDHAENSKRFFDEYQNNNKLYYIYLALI